MNPRLEDWTILTLGPQTKVVQGKVYRHQYFQDGQVITTSDIVDIDGAYQYVTTRNTNYRLGNPSPQEELYEYIRSPDSPPVQSGSSSTG